MGFAWEESLEVMVPEGGHTDAFFGLLPCGRWGRGEKGKEDRRRIRDLYMKGLV